jgi:spore coat protein A
MVINPCLTIATLIAIPAVASAQLPGGTLDPSAVPKFETPLLIPPAMPLTGVIRENRQRIEYYEIAVRQFEQQILPAPLPDTTVWGYGSVQHPGTVAEGGTFNYPAFTIESRYRVPVRVKWINDLVDEDGRYLPHLFSIDQVLHWANPPGPRDRKGTAQEPYAGPVPMITHVHGAETHEESDGYPEAWYLPDAVDVPAGYFETGTYYDVFKGTSHLGDQWSAGSAVFEYPNEMYATTLWYHDHTLGMTRANVYAGPAGFYLLRGGPGDWVWGRLPGPAPSLDEEPDTSHHEIPIVIQDRSFNADGSLYYPDHRAFFEGLDADQLQIPFEPDPAFGGASDVPGIWNPEFFGNTMVVNGNTWPYLDVEQRRYRFRLLNGCNSRFLILRFSVPLPFVQIGGDGGFLPRPVQRDDILLAPAERADVIVDFSGLPVGTTLELLNIGPDEPFGGGTPGVDFDVSDPGTTGQVMQFRVGPRNGCDWSTPPMYLWLPHLRGPGRVDSTRRLTLNEIESETVLVAESGEHIRLDPTGVPFAPVQALLGTLEADGSSTAMTWGAPITETPTVGDTEVWEIHNFTVDAHPIHIHQVQFKILDRRDMATGDVRPSEPWEDGFKDTVIAYPGEVTRVKMRFELPGLFVWHCHIIEHEDNEMMRPYRVLPGCDDEDDDD